MYKLDTPESDWDERGVYVNTELSKIIGLDTDQFDTVDRKGEFDEVYYELRHFLRLLRKTNSVVMEILFNENWLEKSPNWELFVENRDQLIDSKRFFVSLTGGPKAEFNQGYIGNEIRLMMGERTGLLGSKRKNNLEKYGYSYKNAAQALRLIYSAINFYQVGVFHTDFSQNPKFELVKDIKFNPENYKAEQVRELVETARKELIETFNERAVDFSFEQEIADKICLEIYSPYITASL
jgi:predicted nucleotidyltransferase